MAASEQKVPEQKDGITISKPPEAQMLAVVIGKNGIGGLDQIVASIKGYHFLYQEYATDPHDPATDVLDEWQKWELYPDKDPVTKEVYYDPRKKKPDVLEKELGLILFGPGRSLHIPKIKYSKWEKKPGGTEFEVTSKDRLDSPYFFFQYTMAIPAVKVEIEGNATVDIIVNIVIRLINPYKAIFLAGGFESLVDAAVEGAIREHVSQEGFEKLKKELEQSKEGLNHRIMELTNLAPATPTPQALTQGNAPGQADVDDGGFRHKFGIEIIHVNFVRFDLSEGNAEFKKALSQKAINKLNAEAADDKKRETITLAQGKAEGARIMTEAYGSGEAAAQVQQSENYGEAIRDTQATTVVIGGTGTPIGITTPSGNPQDRSRRDRDRGRS
ncbi:hypothetical protein KW785_00120 [Candidatus Parcubacteria bacterium]|nr:hypothetical protein [Candidatus Parcubacteria bacterium]